MRRRPRRGAGLQAWNHRLVGRHRPQQLHVGERPAPGARAVATFSVSLSFSREAAPVELTAAASLACAPGRSKRIEVELTS